MLWKYEVPTNNEKVTPVALAQKNGLTTSLYGVSLITDLTNLQNVILRIIKKRSDWFNLKARIFLIGWNTYITIYLTYACSSMIPKGTN